MNATPAPNLTARLLVVDDHRQARESMADVLRVAGHDVATCGSGKQALNRLEQQAVDVILTDLQMPGMTGLDLLKEVRRFHGDAQVVVVTAHGTVAAAVEAMRLGAFDFIEKPFDARELESVVERALTQESVVRQQGSLANVRSDASHALIGESHAMRQLRAQIKRIAATDETVLIIGESGTGKELVAQALHGGSRRADRPLVSLNCPALSPQLMESELFGHERGAFTGADSRRVGRFELAQQGTILLDEVTEIDLPLQAKLLRVLQERTYERVGSSSTREVDVRVLATTNRDLREAVECGNFRQDLFFRLAVVPLHVPPLRDRREDIPKLARHFLSDAAQRLGGPPLELTTGAIDLMIGYHWPGNVRELENLMKRVTVLCEHQLVSVDDLRPWLLDGSEAATAAPSVPVGISLQAMERQLIEATLERFEGHREKTAHALGIGVRTLANKLRSYGYPPRAEFQGRSGTRTGVAI